MLLFKEYFSVVSDLYVITSEMLATVVFRCLLFKQRFIIIAKYTQLNGN